MNAIIRNLLNSLVSITLLYGCYPSACGQTRALVATPAANGVDGTLLWPSQVMTVPSLTLTGSLNPQVQTFLPNGVFDAPAIAFANSTGTGIYRDAADSIGISTAQVHRLSINSTGVELTIGLKSGHATQGIGYLTGAGGTVTQATDKSTGVTLNKATGAITMNGASLAGGAIVSFTVTNSAVAAADFVDAIHASVGTPGTYAVEVTAIASGSFTITVSNRTGGALSEAIVLRFIVFKAAST